VEKLKTRFLQISAINCMKSKPKFENSQNHNVLELYTFFTRKKINVSPENRFKFYDFLRLSFGDARLYEYN
jgi:hypothetical protein